MAEEAQPGNAMNAFVRFKVLSTLPSFEFDWGVRSQIVHRLGVTH